MSSPLDSTEEKIVGIIEIVFSFFIAFMMAFLIAKELLVIQRRGGVLLTQFVACTFYTLLALFLMLRAATKIVDWNK